MVGYVRQVVSESCGYTTIYMSVRVYITCITILVTVYRKYIVSTVVAACP